MSSREGSLEAPKRHPVDWKNADFYNPEKLQQEMERVFDICHGCRRCVNLCTAFPRLFDLIDDGSTGEIDGVEKNRFQEVVDRCYLCDMCFMTKCPYVPPHEWNVDFPHLMLRAKAVKYQQSGAGFRDKLLSSTDLMGKVAANPVIAPTINTLNKTPLARKVLDSTLGIHSDLLQILKHNEIPTCLVEQEVCCGMPKLELGDLQAVEVLKNQNIPHLLTLAQQGYAIISAVPSCVLMYKQELPLLFPEDVAVQTVAAAMFDPFEYLWLRNQDNLLKTDFKQLLGNVSYHIPCHQRVQNIGKKTRDVMQLIPGTSVNSVERCSGHDGTWGVKNEYFADSMKIGRPVFKQMSAPNPDYISSDCAIAARHIEQGICENHSGSKAKKLHPLSLLRLAYGYDDHQCSIPNLQVLPTNSVDLEDKA